MRAAAVTVFITAFFVSFSLSDVLYVDHAASGAHDGSSWSDAYVYLQDALSAATAGDSFWVAAGTYYPDEGAGQTDNDLVSTFDIPDGVVMLGGSDGSKTAVGQRKPVVRIAKPRHMLQ